MTKTIHFISGLPRAGSTLLCNLLAQNPRFDATPTSGIIDIVTMVRNQWNKVLAFQAAPNEEAKLRVMRSVLNGYFDNGSGRPVIFDKSRAWLAMLEMAEVLLERKAKVLVPVRDIRDVLASFERLWRQNAATWEFSQESQHYYQWQTVEGRCATWMNAAQPVGMAINRIQDAVARGFRDRIHFVHFEKLTTHPAETMRGIYQFLGEAPFEHNFNRVEQVTREDDLRHGIPGMHDIRPRIEPVPARWPEYIGKAAERYLPFNVIWAETPGADR